MALGLSETDWSPADRACWEDVLLPKFAVDGLRPLSVVNYLKTYKRWLGYLKSLGLRDYDSPLSSVAPDIGRSFLDNLRGRASAQTAFTEARQLKRLIKTAAPGATMHWLNAAIDCFARELKGPPRLAVPPSSDRIFREGCRMINLGRRLFHVDDGSGRTAVRGRNLVRDGLMLALLAVRPLRLSNFAELRLGENLIFCRSRAWIRIAGNGTKTGAALEVPFPRRLLSGLQYYLGGPRLAFPNARVLPSLWISDRGTPMTDQVASRIIRARTFEAFGTPISAHQFRHAAATFLAEKHPELIALAPDILGHANVFIAERFYNLASPQSGASTLQANLIAIAGTGARRTDNAHRSVRRLRHSGRLPLNPHS